MVTTSYPMLGGFLIWQIAAQVTAGPVELGGLGGRSLALIFYWLLHIRIYVLLLFITAVSDTQCERGCFLCVLNRPSLLPFLD